jgi:hypothetical protein
VREEERRNRCRARSALVVSEQKVGGRFATLGSSKSSSEVVDRLRVDRAAKTSLKWAEREALNSGRARLACLTFDSCCRSYTLS